MILEACVESIKAAKLAEKRNAHQIEFCDRLDLDGISPSLELLKNACKEVTIPIKVILNPNPYNYQYNTKDLRKITSYIDALHDLPIQGLVFGALDRQHRPDMKALQIITDHTDLPITFHKAIDISRDILESTQMLVEQNIVKFILSSGGKSTAMEGVKMLKKMQQLTAISPVEVIAAGKITPLSLPQLHQMLGLKYYHGKRVVGDLNTVK